jgi:hypothetical protein
MNQAIKISRLAPPVNDPLLQPLREVGTEEKTQFWDMDDIYAALRAANRLRIAPETLAHSIVACSAQPSAA